jgi:hypothetical protein
MRLSRGVHRTAASLITHSASGCQFHASWLRDHCSCPRCVDVHSGQKLHASGSFWPPPVPVREPLTQPDGTLVVDWGEPHGISRYAATLPRFQSSSGSNDGTTFDPAPRGQDKSATQVFRRNDGAVVDSDSVIHDGVIASTARANCASFVTKPTVSFSTLMQSEETRAIALRTIYGSGTNCDVVRSLIECSLCAGLCIVTGVPRVHGDEVGVVAIAKRLGIICLLLLLLLFSTTKVLSS